MKNSFSWLIVLSLFLIFNACKNKQVLVQPQSGFWQKDDPGLHGFNTQKLKIAIDRAEDAPHFFSLLIVKNEKLIVEEYFNSKSADDLFQLRSITKTFTSSSLDIAIRQAYFDSPADTIGAFFESLDLDQSKKQINLHQLLNMTSGLTWDENAEVLPLINHQIPNPISTVLQRPLFAPPGSRFNYNTVSTHIAASVIEQQTNLPLETFVKQNLLDSLGIVDYQWEKDPDGNAWGGMGLKLRARDLAKYGQLFLNDGLWNDHEIISKDWVDLCQISQTDVPNSTAGYSYHWWLFEGLYYGYGYGGQLLIIDPANEMIIIALQNHFVPSPTERAQRDFFYDQVLDQIYLSLN